MRPETNLLLRCARPELAPDADNGIGKALQQNIDWDAMLEMARMHGVEAPMASALDGHADAVPAAFLEQLRDGARQNHDVTRQLTDILLDLLPRLQQIGVPTIAFKGPEMAVVASEDFEQRKYHDVDLFIDARHARAVVDLLMQLGYVLKYGGTWDEAEFRWSHGEALKAPDTGLEVDVHWEFLPYRTFGCKFSFEELWDRRSVVTFKGMEISSLSREDLFLNLCIHGCKHRWILLKWIRDIAVLANLDSPLDWTMVKRLASSVGAKRMVALGLHLANDLLGAEIPENATREFPADRMVRSLGRDIRSYLVAGMQYGPTGRDRHKFYLQMRERQRDKIRYSMYLSKRWSDPSRWYLPHTAFFAFLLALVWPVWLVLKKLRSVVSGRGVSQSKAPKSQIDMPARSDQAKRSST